MNLVCPHCGSVNRIPPGKSAAAAKCGRCHRRLFEAKPMPVSTAAMERHIDRNDIPVLVDFWAEWCGPCKAMAPVFAAAANQLEPAVRFLKLDTEAEPVAIARYGIRGIPTMILFANGQPIARQVGATGFPGLIGWLEKALPQRRAV